MLKEELCSLQLALDHHYDDEVSTEDLQEMEMLLCIF